MGLRRLPYQPRHGCWALPSGTLTLLLSIRVPQAAIVFDKFHLICNYFRVIDRVRLDEFRKAEKVDKPVLKGTKYLLLKNRENLTEEQEPRLERVRDSSKNLKRKLILTQGRFGRSKNLIL